MSACTQNYLQTAVALSDEELALKAREGNDECLAVLIMRYLKVINLKAAGQSAGFLETDDLIQEGMIAVIKAIRTYNCEKAASFSTYASTCIENSIKTAVQYAGRQKHQPLNDYLPIHSEEISTRLSDKLAENSMNSPEALVIKKEEFAFLKKKITSLLSEFERKILMLYLKGCTYKKMSDELGVAPKAVDNALQRVRKKLASEGV